MLIDLASDLHLICKKDLGKDFFKAKAPVLALLGDICEVSQVKSLKSVFKKMSNTWDHVFYVLGNHEFYRGSLEKTSDYIRKELSVFPNIHIMDNDCLAVDDVAFIGSTLWSDMDRNNPITQIQSKISIADYFYIFTASEFNLLSTRAIVPEDTVKLFNKNVDFLKRMIAAFDDYEKIAILTHHAPSYASISKRFKTSPTTGAFASNLEYLMIDNKKIKLWLHGHCHDDFEYEINQCKVVCHPMGYRKEKYIQSTQYVPLTVEI